MEKDDFDTYRYSTPTEFKDKVRNDVEYIRQVPNKDKEFKMMMWEDELEKEENKNLEVNDWSMHDGQYPRLGPIIFNNTRDETPSNDEMTDKKLKHNITYF